jgi:hypothetical protein
MIRLRLPSEVRLTRNAYNRTCQRVIQLDSFGLPPLQWAAPIPRSSRGRARRSPSMLVAARARSQQLAY